MHFKVLYMWFKLRHETLRTQNAIKRIVQILKDCKKIMVKERRRWNIIKIYKKFDQVHVMIIITTVKCKYKSI